MHVKTAIKFVLSASVALSGQFIGARYAIAEAEAQTQATDLAATGRLEEVIVTSTKESRSIQAVPAAITAIDSESITSRGIASLAGAQNLMPSVRLQTQGANTELYIRGVGVTLDLPMIEMPSAYNINGVYVPRELSSASLFDIFQVEALPGPQGTLYGRGALGGTVNVVTTRPSNNNATSVLFEAGNYGTFRGVLTQNFALSDEFRLRIGVSKNYHEGYMSSGADSADELAGRVELSYTPTDDLDIYLWWHEESKGSSPANLIAKGSSADPRSQTFPFPDNPWNDTLTGPYESYATLGPIDARERDWNGTLIGAEINYSINDALTLTYIPSYAELDWSQEYWVIHKLTVYGARIQQQTHELRLAYDDHGRVRWLAGFYGYDLSNIGGIQLQFGPDELYPGQPGGTWLDATDAQDHTLKGWAAFGQMTVDLTDDLRLVAGGRYSVDDRKIWGYQPGIVAAPTLFNNNPNTNPIYANSHEWSHADWKLGLEYDLNPDQMVYAFVQTASQPGTFDTFPDARTEQAELTSYTVGIKNQFLQGRLIVNDELFYYDYTSLMTQAWDAATGSLRLRNADKTIIWGNQLDVSFRATPDTSIRLNVGYLSAHYDEFVVGGIDYHDNSLQSAPEWTVSLGLSHEFVLPNGGSIRADVDTRYESAFWGDFAHSPGFYQDSYFKTDASLTYAPADGNWTLALWIKNIEDTDVQSSGGSGGPFDPGAATVFLEPPRTYGLRFTASFGD